MIRVINRQLIIPKEDFLMSDGGSVSFQMAIPISLDVSKFRFEIHLEYVDGATYSKELSSDCTDGNVTLSVNVDAEMLKAAGSVLVWIAMYDAKDVDVWNSYKGILFIPGATNKPADFRDKLKGLELAQVEEDERREAEKARELAEKSRVEAESARVTAEEARAAAENARALSESEYASTESAAVKAEQARADAEKSRVEAEKLRVQAEKDREAEESKRVEAEKARVEAEKKREQK